VRQRRHITNGQFPDLAAADPLGLSDRGLAIFQDPPGVDQKRLTCRRERDSFALALEKFYPQFAFQVVNLLAEGRLRNVSAIRGGVKFNSSAAATKYSR
jgi:hypothetical protein